MAIKLSGEITDEAGGESPRRMERPLRPSQCRGAMRKALAAEYREIVKGFVDQARSGSAAHVRLANELLEAPVKKQRTGEGEIARMIRKLERA